MYIFTRFNMDYIYFFFPHEFPRRYLVLVYVAHCSAAIEERREKRKKTHDTQIRHFYGHNKAECWQFEKAGSW